MEILGHNFLDKALANMIAGREMPDRSLPELRGSQKGPHGDNQRKYLKKH